MKQIVDTLLLLALGALFAGCAAINHPLCRLQRNERPLPPCHAGLTPHWQRSDTGEWFPFSYSPAAGHQRGVVLLIPGWDSVTCDYEPLTAALTARGFGVYGMELRCQRYDPDVRRRGNPRDWESWVADAKAFTHFVQARTPRGVPIFIHGQSFGTIIGIPAVADLQREGRVRGVILHSPAIAMIAPDVTPFKRWTVNTFAGIRFPQVLGIELTGMHITADRGFDCAWLHSSDRLREGYKIRFLKMATELGAEARVCVKEIRVPMLALKGGNDKLAPQNLLERRDAYEHFLQHELPPRAEVKRYAHGDHMLFRGVAAKAAIADILHWLDELTPRG